MDGCTYNLEGFRYGHCYTDLVTTPPKVNYPLKVLLRDDRKKKPYTIAALIRADCDLSDAVLSNRNWLAHWQTESGGLFLSWVGLGWLVCTGSVAAAGGRGQENALVSRRPISLASNIPCSFHPCRHVSRTVEFAVPVPAVGYAGSGAFSCGECSPILYPPRKHRGPSASTIRRKPKPLCKENILLTPLSVQLEISAPRSARSLLCTEP
jgi:hypothetical protein